jgi:hypothetical protein
VAALTYGRQLAVGGPTPSLRLAVESTGRGIYEGKRMQADGGLKKGKQESAALLRAYGGDSKIMMALLKGCMDTEDADPTFRSLNDSGALMAAARKADPLCRATAACANPVR